MLRPDIFLPDDRFQSMLPVHSESLVGPAPLIQRGLHGSPTIHNPTSLSSWAYPIAPTMISISNLSVDSRILYLSLLYWLTPTRNFRTCKHPKMLFLDHTLSLLGKLFLPYFMSPRRFRNKLGCRDDGVVEEGHSNFAHVFEYGPEDALDTINGVTFPEMGTVLQRVSDGTISDRERAEAAMLMLGALVAPYHFTRLSDSRR